MLVSKYLRRDEGSLAYHHWCPGCGREHPLPDSWEFDGNLEKPTFNPSFKQTWVWMGVERTCHYHLHAGVLKFYDDCDHELRNQHVPLPELPEHLRD